jgi:hypothetical protein
MIGRVFVKVPKISFRGEQRHSNRLWTRAVWVNKCTAFANYCAGSVTARGIIGANGNRRSDLAGKTQLAIHRA